MHDEWFNPHEDLHIPAGTAAPRSVAGSIPDAMFRAEAPRSIDAPSGSATANFRREDGCLVVNCHEQLMNDEHIAKSLKWAKTEYGPENVKSIEILVSDYTMAVDGWMLIRWGFERKIIANDMSGLHCWRRELPQRRKKVQEG